MSDDFVFAGRDRQVDRLYSQFRNMLNGKGNLVLVSGEVGTGKTVLVNEFLQRIIHDNSDCIIAKGECNPILGNGDNYLPFREIMTSIIGLDKETPTKDNKQANRTIETLIEFAPDIIDIFVPGAGLLTKVGTHIFPLKEKLEALIKDREKVKKDGIVSLATNQNWLFEQYRQLLISESMYHPIIILLENLHWIDQASLGLLFYLVRRISNSRVLVIATCRPSYISQHSNNGIQNLQDVIDELSLHGTDLILNLDLLEYEDQLEFTNQFLDSNFYPNCFSGSFRNLLSTRSAGNALFLAEILNHLIEHKKIAKDSEGSWCSNQELDPTEIPIVIGKVIEDRISHLTKETRKVLNIGCVEGEKFTAQIVARIASIQGDLIDEILDENLTNYYRLINPESPIRVGKNVLIKYKFRHFLFQSYLYKNLGPSHKIQYHKAVAELLEEYNSESIEEIAPQLAFHFTECLEYRKASQYKLLNSQRELRKYALTSAKEQALEGIALLNKFPEPNDVEKKNLVIDLYRVLADASFLGSDYDEALSYYNRLLGLCVISQNKADVYRLIGNVYEKQGQYKEAGNYYDMGLQLIVGQEETIEYSRLVVAKAYIHNCFFEVDKGREMALSVLSNLEKLGNTADQLFAFKVIASSYHPSGNWSMGIKYCLKQSALADTIGDAWELAEINKGLSDFYMQSGKLENALTSVQKSIDFFEQIGGINRLSWLYGFRAQIFNQMGDYQEGIDSGFKALSIAKKINDVNDQEHILHWIGDSELGFGKLANSLDLYKQSIEIAEKIHPSHTIEAYFKLGRVLIYLGELQNSMDIFDKGYKLAKEYKIEREEWSFLWGKGLILTKNGQLSQALPLLEEALDCATRSNRYLGKIFSFNALAEFYVLKRDLVNAEENREKGFNLALNGGYKFQIAISEKISGIIAFEKGDLESSESLFNKASYSFKGLKAKYEYAETLNRLSQCLEKMGLVKNAHEIGREAIEILKECGV